MRAALVLALTAAPALSQTGTWELTETASGCSTRLVYADQSMVMFFFGHENQEMSFYVSHPDMTAEDDVAAPASVGFDDIDPWNLPMLGYEVDGFPGAIVSRGMDDTMELFLEEASGASRLEVRFEAQDRPFVFAIAGAGPGIEEARACFEDGPPEDGPATDGAAPQASAARQG